MGWERKRGKLVEFNRLLRGAQDTNFVTTSTDPTALPHIRFVITLDADYRSAYGLRGLADYELGEFERARASCDAKPDYWISQQCLAVTYEKLGRHADAEAQLAKIKAAFGDSASYQYATIYAQWGNVPKALEWLDTAVRVRDPGLVFLKTDPLLDPLRPERRFHAIERELKFPD